MRMALLKIARMGHPVLLAKARAVDDPTAPGIRTLVADMIETMHDAAGAGLAAPQVHVPLRLFVYSVPAQRSAGADDPPRAVAALINPVITPIGEEIAVQTEGCRVPPGSGTRASTSMARPWRARRAGSSPWCCSTRTTISTVFSTRCA
jgi:peptide deformylase